MKTKLHLLTFMLFVFIKTEAQFVTIPDPDFVQWLTIEYPSCMSGNLMDTTCADILSTKYVYFNGEQFADVTGIQYFDSLTSLAFTNMPNLTFIPPLPSTLTWLNCENNPIDSLPSLPSGLQHLSCGNCNLIELPQLPDSLLSLHCQNNQLTTIPSLPATLYSLVISDNPGIQCLPPVPGIFFLIWNNTGITCIPHIITGDSIIPTMDGMPLCDLFNNNGCDLYWNIHGKVYMEDDMDCIMDSSEMPLHGIKVTLYDNGTFIQQTFTNTLGEYSFNTDTGTYQCLVDSAELMTKVCPSSGYHTAAIDSVNMFSTGNDFGLICPPDFDIGVLSCVGVNPIRPGNLSYVHIVAGDLISTNSSGLCMPSIGGSVVVVMDGPVTFYSSQTGALNPIVSGDTLTYLISDFSLVDPQQDFNFVIYADTSATIGDTVCFYISVSILPGDIDTLNNVSSCCFPVVNSFDPNDKIASFEGIADTSIHWITYTIRFQNTGNAPAEDIYIIDTLDTYLDPSTLQLLSYSHEPVFHSNGSKLVFDFPDINLPDSVNDEPNSHGYVQYKVKRSANLPLGTEIANTAFIYFDFNAPVVTNTTSTIFDVIASIVLHSFNGKAMIYPNPVANGDMLNIKYDDGIDKFIEFRITDLNGKMVYKWAGKNPDRIHLNDLAPGAYILQVEAGKEITTSKLIIHE